MLYRPDWEQVQKRYTEYWACENHDRPILWITAPRDKLLPYPPSAHKTLKDRWCDTGYMLEKANISFQNTYYGGESFPLLSPDLGPDLFASLYGIPIEFGEDTSWSIHTLTEWDTYTPFQIDRECFYYKKIVEMTEAAAEDGQDKYLVGVTDIHAGFDGLVAMRGPETLCIDTLEHPDFLRRGAMDLFEGFKTLYGELAEIAGRYQRGSSNWMGIWHPGRWYVTSCDFICLISENMFEDLIVEELEAELAYLDASVFHLDGPGALRHLDRLLSIKKLNGIQWVYGAGQPTASHWLDVLKKIQRAGKAFQVDITPEELPVLLENLAPEGAMYIVNTETEADARDLEALAARAAKGKGPA
ncbi:MAG: trimethylamine corrinoid protein 2 [Treponema sp.]|jgi:hypothetical protein|nr:trimethylamine corrinoid protein 2 [Treponema sp.]